jgi:gluconolactonase
VVPQRIRAVFEQIDERFHRVSGDEYVAVLYDEGRWLEGPAYSHTWRSLLFSDIPNDRVLRLDETTGAVGVWRQPAGYANGRTIDRQGRVISCEHGTRAVTRTEFDGTVSVVADRWDGRRLNSPNDVVVRADGTVWFTDPSYGIDSDYEGARAASETDGCHVYRVDPDGTVVRVADDFERPNGLAFSADERQLYIVDTRRKHIRRFDVDANGLSGGEVLAECDAGSFDGIRIDHQNRIWAAAHDGLHCFDPTDGALLGKLRLPEICANLTFGGPKGNILYVTASNTLFSIMTNCTGASYPTG